jgi:hypothetical protein
MGQSAKLIKSKVRKSERPGQWHNLEEIVTFIQGIDVGGELKPDQLLRISRNLITGIPTPWARAKIYSFAFQYVASSESSIQQSTLKSFFRELVGEWKGLLAFIALHSDRVSFSEPIYMNPANPLDELSGAFGRMLLDDADLWTDQQKKLTTNPNELPYIQLLRLRSGRDRGEVIGGTSPFSIVFPGVEYANLKESIGDDVLWYRDGKFADPMSCLGRDELQKLYLFINNIVGVTYSDKDGAPGKRIGTIEEFEKNINLARQNNQLKLSNLVAVLQLWQAEIKDKDKELNLQINGTVAKYPNLAMPYKALLDSHQKVYQLISGEFTFEPGKNSIKDTLSDLQDILKEDKKIIGWFESSDRKNPLSKSAVYYLKVNDVRDTENPTKYFSLPLSMKGIQMFTQQQKIRIKHLVSHNEPNFDIVGKISEQGNLIVDLTVSIDNQPYKLNSKEYEIEWATTNSKVIMWPNFISDHWNAYYLYSEYPLSGQGIKFVPFFKKAQEQEILTVERALGDKLLKSLVYSGSTEEDSGSIEEDQQSKGLDIDYLVKYPAGQVPQEMHKYEVMKSNRPIAGLEIRIENAGKSQMAGYLVVKDPRDETMGERAINDLTTEVVNQDTIVGIDFGSNNSCVYTLRDGNASPVAFKNRRLALVGIDAEGGTIADRDELLFFSNEPASKGQVKSWLHEHDVRYIGPRNNADRESIGSRSNTGEEIAGGVAVNKKNILVKEMDKDKITTQAGILHYNMKWLSDREGGFAKKTAFLKDLWLSICADLYEDKHAPKELRWSYPGSMSVSDLRRYELIYRELPSITPIVGLRPSVEEEPQTEAESVCKYALSKPGGYGLDDNIFLGIDVGGSTSDILLLAKDADKEPKLYKQSSLRIAAGVFFDAVIKSADFRKAIYAYHQGQKKIKVENIREILSEGNKAPFYLNSVFDQLTVDDFSVFYGFIGREAPFVYAIPAYVTGLLVFYSGKLCAKTIKENDLTAVRKVHLMPFGKGGRLFHWLQTLPGSRTTEAYYNECFKKGYGNGAEMVTLKYCCEDLASENKSEVSRGLAVDRELIYDPSVRATSDIFAEKGICHSLKGGQFDETEIVEDKYFEKIGQFTFPAKLENFDTFLKIFLDFVGQKAGLVRNIAVLETRSKELSSRLSAFIENDSEYAKARAVKQESGRPLEYRFPILIAEGLCYLEQILIPEIFKS